MSVTRTRSARSGPATAATGLSAGPSGSFTDTIWALVIGSAAVQAWLSILWRAYKWMLHFWTHQCELERILCSVNSSVGGASGATGTTDSNETRIIADATVRVSRCFADSHQLYSALVHVYGTDAMSRRVDDTHIAPMQLSSDEDKQLCVTTIVEAVIARKRLDVSQPTVQTKVLPLLTTCVYHIVDVNALLRQLTLATTPYDTSNRSHEARLMLLWQAYRPDVRLSQRRCKEWEELGFQGLDPATDFRAMGVLGLAQLLHFARVCPDDAQRILGDSIDHGLAWFTFAITGINLTADLVRLSSRRVLDPFYHRHGATMAAFHALYAVVFVRFNEMWRRERPASVMAFADVHKRFLVRLEREVAVAHMEGYEWLEPLRAVEAFAEDVLQVEKEASERQRA